MSGNFSRRKFIKSSLYGLIAASAVGRPVFGQTVLKQRLDWDTFKQGRDYASFLTAISKMRANTNAADKRSWQYWTNVHLNNCPHGIAYFLGWHRGYLNYFEQQLRAVSGNPNLTLPYWDYYTNPVIPPEFTNPASWNPLYVPRVNTDISAALTLAPFSDTLVNMQRGTANAFEPSIESAPHNPVHNIIGGIMATMQSPSDPIFWLHHANIDRLWNAWVAAGNGRTMPARTDAYWNGNYTYAAALTAARRTTINTRTDLGYFYQSETMPASLPSVAFVDEEPIQLAMADTPGSLGIGFPRVTVIRPPKRPQRGNFQLTGKRSTGPNRLSLGGARQIGLNENSVSADIPIDTESSQTLTQIFQQSKSLPFGRASNSSSVYTSIQVVLDDVRISGGGANGGYFYKIFLNLPDNGNASDSEDQYLLGNVGPFQLSAAAHHNAATTLVFPATGLVDALSSVASLKQLSVSFVRISGANSPAGEVITVGECRIEVSNDDPV